MRRTEGAESCPRSKPARLELSRILGSRLDPCPACTRTSYQSIDRDTGSAQSGSLPSYCAIGKACHGAGGLPFTIMRHFSSLRLLGRSHRNDRENFWISLASEIGGALPKPSTSPGMYLSRSLLRPRSPLRPSDGLSRYRCKALLDKAFVAFDHRR